MSPLSLAVTVFTVVAVALVALVCIRFFKLRSKGASVLLRPMPAKDSHGWRHGIVRYTPTSLEFYKLRSVGITADLVLDRMDIEVAGYRDLRDEEASFMPEQAEAVHIRTPLSQYELAMDLRSAMALHTWVESAPSPRRESLDISTLRKRAQGKY